MKIEYTPIGIVHSPFKDLNSIPRQASIAKGSKATVEIYPEYQGGLKDLDGFSHIILLCHFHKVSGYSLEVVPPIDTQSRGLFATWSPKRPNPIGLSVVQLDAINKNNLMISNLDILDGTPVLDIKPYFREFDSDEKIRTGWLGKVKRQNE